MERGKGGCPQAECIVAGDHEEILADLLKTANPGDFILVKGSRGMGMDRVAEGIRRLFAGVYGKGAVA